jgi:alkanesulfonate monooxygenase SsuD/methylene tetrahydromethanopterin reductase-like flavin-dependent oxidoreductase (luciferase family)
MPLMSGMRFNCIQPGMEPKAMSARYRAFIEMARYGDEHGIGTVTLEEHHGVGDGYSPSPLAMAGMVFGATNNIGVSISALLLPLHDPLRVAEDIAVLDLASGGRLSTILGLGYRPEEYAQAGKDWKTRGRIMDECVEVLLKAWTAEPFEYRGTTVRVTPKPFTDPHPIVLVGGTSKPAARRAARFGLPMFAAATVPELEAYYYAQCQEHGTQGFYMAPSADFASVHVAEDPDRAWSELGRHFLHEATQYASWQTPDISSAVHSHATTVDELRAEGIYQVLTPDEAIARATAQGELYLHPLVGGMPIDEGWECVRLACEQVIPEVPAG